MHSFTPVTTSFHKRIPQKPLKSLVTHMTVSDDFNIRQLVFTIHCSCHAFQKRGRWGSLHACIAWQIYYKELKVNITLTVAILHSPNKISDLHFLVLFAVFDTFPFNVYT